MWAWDFYGWERDWGCSKGSLAKKSMNFLSVPKKGASGISYKPVQV